MAKKYSKAEKEYLKRMQERLKQRQQPETIEKEGRIKEEPKPKQKRKIIAPLLKLLKPKPKFSRTGLQRVMKLEPVIKRPKKTLSAREKALKKIVQKRQGVSNVNLQEVLRKFYEDRSQHLLRHYRGSRELSFKTRQELERILQIQNLSKTADMKQQRILRERNILGKSMNLMKAHYNLNKSARLDFTGVKEDNILKSRNIFLENPENNILRKRPGSRHILDLADDNNIMKPKKRLEF